MVQKHRVDGLAHRVVAAEREAHIRHPARDFRARQVLLDPACGVDEIHRVVVVFLNAGGNGKDVGVKNDVFGRKTDLVDQNAVRPLADLDLALVGISLAFLVKRHHHGGGAIAAHQFGLLAKGVFPFFHADGVDNALALHTA